jgi:ABC-type multidrug transport system fused ATPase/permease subunit
MKKFVVIRSIWMLLEKSERQRLLVLILYLLVGTFLEVLSVGALVPLIQVLTQSDLRTKYELIEKLFPNTNDQFIIAVILIGVIFVFLVKEIFLVFSLWAQRGFIARIEARFQTELFDRYTHQSYDFHLANNSSLLSRNILNSTHFINNILDPILMLLTDGFVTVAICVALIMIEPISMFVTICLVGTVATIFHSFSKRRIEQWGIERQNQDGVKLQQLNETFGGMKEIIVTGSGDYFRNKFSLNIKTLANVNRKFTMLLGMPRLYLELLAIVGIAALVLSMLALGRTPESMVPLLTLFAGGAFRLMPAVNRITLAFQSLRMGRPIIEVLHSDIESTAPVKKSFLAMKRFRFEDSIRFENVYYTYPNTSRDVMAGVNFRIYKGSKVGIIGTTGAGKSTMVDILLGLLSPTLGRVTVDGVDIATDVGGWQNLVGYVPQSIYLIDSSIKANIAFGIDVTAIDDAKVLAALEMAQMIEFVNTLPEGLDELVGERGVRLSGGQRQRLGIARALYLDPPILVFDEATSALDIETEKDVLKSLDGLSSDKTIFIVTHRVTALEQCDQTLVLADGKLIAY